MTPIQRLEKKWRDVATLFYIHRRWLYQLSQLTDQLGTAVKMPSQKGKQIHLDLIEDLEALTGRLEANSERILELLGG
jgi:hypothetical protein